MPQFESNVGSDGPSQQSQSIESNTAHARQDAGFSQVGDHSSNMAWSEMTGGKVSGSDHAAGGANAVGGSAGGGDAWRDQTIDFSQHGDIYASTAGMPPSADAGGGSSGGADGGKGGSGDVHGGSAGGGGGEGSIGMPPLSYDGKGGSSGLSAGESAGLSPSENTGMSTGESAGMSSGDGKGDGKGAYGAEFHQDYDPKTSSLDGSNFYNLSDSQLRSMSESQLDSVNSNNVANMEGRVADLGDKMPNVMFRGAGGEFAGEMDSLAAGQKTGNESGRHYAMSKEFSGDPATQLSDLAANMQKGKSYAESSGGNLYAFEMKDPGMMDGARSREIQGYAPEPFAGSTNAGENVIKATPDNASHIATFHHAELQHENRNTPLPEGMSMQHVNKLDTHLQARNVDKVLTQIESQHADFLRQQQADRARTAAQTQAEQGVWSRISDSVKSWF